MAVAIVLVLALAVWVFGKKQPGSDTLDDIGGEVDKNASPAVMAIARAIATAEGFYSPGTRPSRNHNPGDMTADLIGRSTGVDGDFVVYDTDADGWDNLYAQINAWLEGTSKYHSTDSTISDLAGLGNEVGYTSTDQATWANTVANKLGVSIDTPIGEISG